MFRIPTSFNIPQLQRSHFQLSKINYPRNPLFERQTSRRHCSTIKAYIRRRKRRDSPVNRQVRLDLALCRSGGRKIDVVRMQEAEYVGTLREERRGRTVPCFFLPPMSSRVSLFLVKARLCRTGVDRDRKWPGLEESARPKDRARQ